MTSGKRLSYSKVKAAIENSGGLIARVAKASGYTWGAVRNFIAANPELAKMMEEESERVNDAAENTIITKIMEGDESSAKWWLARTRRAKFGKVVLKRKSRKPKSPKVVTIKIVYENESDRKAS